MRDMSNRRERWWYICNPDAGKLYSLPVSNYGDPLPPRIVWSNLQLVHWFEDPNAVVECGCPEELKKKGFELAGSLVPTPRQNLPDPWPSTLTLSE